MTSTKSTSRAEEDCDYTERYINIIKTHDSESRGQEETAIIRETKNTRPLSELFTRKSVHKTTNAVVKPP